jgi:hypothetical protein
MPNSSDTTNVSNTLTIVTNRQPSKKANNGSSANALPTDGDVTRLGLANQNKLSKLPKDVQSIVNVLSHGELNLLRAALSRYTYSNSFCVCVITNCSFRHQHFDFMALPLEIRDMIYTLLLLPEDSNKFRRSRGKKEMFPIPGLTVLRTCKQVCSEGLRILYLRGHLRLVPTITTVCDSEFDYTPITKAKKLKLDFTVRRFYGSYRLSPSTTTLTRLLREITTLYEGEHKSGNRQPVVLHINLKVGHELICYHQWKSTDIFDPTNTHLQPTTWTGKGDVREVTWLRVQLPVLIDEMRADLLGKAPHVTLTSNVDNLGPYTIITRRVSEKEILFSDPSPSGQSGKLWMPNARYGVIEFEPFENGEVI